MNAPIFRNGKYITQNKLISIAYFRKKFNDKVYYLYIDIYCFLSSLKYLSVFLLIDL